MKVRRSLQGFLCVTVVLTGASLLYPQSSLAPAVATDYRASQGLPRADQAQGIVPSLPGALERPSPSTSQRDLFTAPAPPAPAPPAAIATAQPSPPPALPRLTAQFLGRIKSPDGLWLLILRSGEQSIVAAPGVPLNDGFVIEAMLTAKGEPAGPTADVAAIVALHAGRNHRERLELPLQP